MHTTHQHQRSPSISSPIAQAFPYPAPIPRPSHKARRPSLTNTMSKFKDSLRERISENVAAIQENVSSHTHRRAHSNGSRGNEGPYEPRSMVISEPKLTGSADSLPSTRLAPLGSGAIVVGTPQEALALAGGKAGYRGAPAAASAPSGLNHYHRQQPAPVAEEEESEYEASQISPPLPPLPTSGPSSPTMSSRGLQQREWAQPRRSEESYSSSQASGSRGMGPVLPDRRSGSSSRSRRGSPLAQPHPLLPHTLPRVQPKVASLEDEPQSEFDTESLTVPDVSEQQPQRTTGSAPSRPNSNVSSIVGSHVEGDCFSGAPQLPIDLASALPQPPFDPILMSNLPANMHKVEPGKLIVILETGDATVKSTLKTLTSRPSYLATYLKELVASTASSPNAVTPAPVDENGDADGMSMYSQRSEFEDSEDEANYTGFNSLFQDHLASTGIIKPRKTKRRADVTAAIHIFLDRPSEPYEYIISYLRAPVVQTNPEGMLPYAARLFPAAQHSFHTARLEALLDLRDEASYLGLGDLLQLCGDELTGQVPLVADVGRESVHSTHTLCEPATAKGKESAGNSPAVHSVDIPVMLPSLNSATAPKKAGRTNSMDSNASSASKRERRAGGLDLITQSQSQSQSQSELQPQPLRVKKLANASQLRAQERERTKPVGNYF